MKIKKIFKYLLPFAIASIAIPAVATACGDTQTNSGVKAGTVKQKTFNSKVSASAKKSSISLKANQAATNETLVIDPNANPDALQQANQTFKTLDKNELQTDFNNVLTKFFKTYEYEAEINTGSTETEIESDLKKVEVKDYNPETLTATLAVTYEVEKETEDNKNDTEQKVVQDEVQEKKLTLKPQFATYAEIQSIEKMLKDADKKDKEDNNVNFGTDIDDLIELYIGDPEDNEKSIFEQVSAFTSKNNNKLGGLLGYEIKLSDLAYTPEGQTGNNNTHSLSIFAPSSVITEFYVPDTVFNGVDLTFDYSKLQQKTIEDIKKINSKDLLNEILMVPISSDVSVQSVTVTETQTNPTPEQPTITASQTTPAVDSLDVVVKFGPVTPTTPENPDGGGTTTPTTPETGGKTTEGTNPPTEGTDQTVTEIKLVIKTSWLKQTTTPTPTPPAGKN